MSIIGKVIVSGLKCFPLGCGCSPSSTAGKSLQKVESTEQTSVQQEIEEQLRESMIKNVGDLGFTSEDMLPEIPIPQFVVGLKLLLLVTNI